MVGNFANPAEDFLPSRTLLLSLCLAPAAVGEGKTQARQKQEAGPKQQNSKSLVKAKKNCGSEFSPEVRRRAQHDVRAWAGRKVEHKDHVKWLVAAGATRKNYAQAQLDRKPSGEGRQEARRPERVVPGCRPGRSPPFTREKRPLRQVLRSRGNLFLLGRSPRRPF